MREESIAGKKGGEVAKAVTRTGRFGNDSVENIPESSIK